VFVIVEPAGAVVATVSVNVALAAFASVAMVQVIVPVPPTAGVVQLQPPGDESDVNVVFAGSVSVSETLCATFGPLLVTLIV
jgi:long-subunit acyl-CoA synthetase (AMP-forming)